MYVNECLDSHIQLNTTPSNEIRIHVLSSFNSASYISLLFSDIWQLLHQNLFFGVVSDETNLNEIE